MDVARQFGGWHDICFQTRLQQGDDIDARELGEPARYLEEELQRRYRDATPSTLTVLQQRCELIAEELAAAEQNLLDASDVPALRKAGGCSFDAVRTCSVSVRRSQSTCKQGCAVSRLL